jgi:F0F1-type ATP synthase assembly protein I
MNTTQHTVIDTQNIGSIKRAELLSSLGAGVLGAGIGILLTNILGSYALPILVLGLVAHTIGMTKKHSLEQQGNKIRVWWVEGLYWLCWVLLGAMLLYVVYSLIL